MLRVPINMPKVRLTLSLITAQSFCLNVLNILYKEDQINPTASFLGACYLFNKIHNKNSKKITLSIPMEYGYLIKEHCLMSCTYSDLEDRALYTILEQLDKQL